MNTTDESVPDAWNPHDGTGRWKYIKKIGLGGFGVVYHAEDTVSGEQVAVKALKTDKPRDALLATREVRCSRRFQECTYGLTGHVMFAKYIEDFTGLSNYAEKALMAWSEDQTWNELKISDVVVSKPYVVMELVHGITVSAAIKREQLLPKDRLPILMQSVYALKFLRDKKAVHRDFRAHNLMWCSSRQELKVLDFGLALHKMDPKLATSEHPLIRTYWRRDTYWIPPEVKQKEPVCNFYELEPSSFDIFSFGVFALEMILDPDSLRLLKGSMQEIEEKGLKRLMPYKAIKEGFVTRGQISALGLDTHLFERIVDPKPKNRPKADEIYRAMEAFANKRVQPEGHEKKKRKASKDSAGSGETGPLFVPYDAKKYDKRKSNSDRKPDTDKAPQTDAAPVSTLTISNVAKHVHGCETLAITDADNEKKALTQFQSRLDEYAGAGRNENNMYMVKDLAADLYKFPMLRSYFINIMLEFAQISANPEPGSRGVSCFRLVCIIDCAVRNSFDNVTKEDRKDLRRALAPSMSQFIRCGTKAYGLNVPAMPGPPNSTRATGKRLHVMIEKWRSVGVFPPECLNPALPSANLAIEYPTAIENKKGASEGSKPEEDWHLSLLGAMTLPTKNSVKAVEPVESKRGPAVQTIPQPVESSLPPMTAKKTKNPNKALVDDGACKKSSNPLRALIDDVEAEIEVQKTPKKEKKKKKHKEKESSMPSRTEAEIPPVPSLTLEEKMKEILSQSQRIEESFEDQPQSNEKVGYERIEESLQERPEPVIKQRPEQILPHPPITPETPILDDKPLEVLSSVSKVASVGLQAQADLRPVENDDELVLSPEDVEFEIQDAPTGEQAIDSENQGVEPMVQDAPTVEQATVSVEVTDVEVREQEVPESETLDHHDLLNQTLELTLNPPEKAEVSQTECESDLDHREFLGQKTASSDQTEWEILEKQGIHQEVEIEDCEMEDVEFEAEMKDDIQTEAKDGETEPKINTTTDVQMFEENPNVSGDLDHLTFLTKNPEVEECAEVPEVEECAEVPEVEECTVREDPEVEECTVREDPEVEECAEVPEVEECTVREDPEVEVPLTPEVPEVEVPQSEVAQDPEIEVPEVEESRVVFEEPAPCEELVAGSFEQTQGEEESEVVLQQDEKDVESGDENKAISQLDPVAVSVQDESSPKEAEIAVEQDAEIPVESEIPVNTEEDQNVEENESVFEQEARRLEEFNAALADESIPLDLGDDQEGEEENLVGETKISPLAEEGEEPQCDNPQAFEGVSEERDTFEGVSEERDTFEGVTAETDTFEGVSAEADNTKDQDYFEGDNTKDGDYFEECIEENEAKAEEIEPMEVSQECDLSEEETEEEDGEAEPIASALPSHESPKDSSEIRLPESKPESPEREEMKSSGQDQAVDLAKNIAAALDDEPEENSAESSSRMRAKQEKRLEDLNYQLKAALRRNTGAGENSPKRLVSAEEEVVGKKSVVAPESDEDSEHSSTIDPSVVNRNRKSNVLTVHSDKNESPISAGEVDKNESPIDECDERIDEISDRSTVIIQVSPSLPPSVIDLEPSDFELERTSKSRKPVPQSKRYLVGSRHSTAAKTGNAAKQATATKRARGETPATASRTATKKRGNTLPLPDKRARARLDDPSNTFHAQILGLVAEPKVAEEFHEDLLGFLGPSQPKPKQTPKPEPMAELIAELIAESKPQPIPPKKPELESTQLGPRPVTVLGAQAKFAQKPKTVSPPWRNAVLPSREASGESSSSDALPKRDQPPTSYNPDQWPDDETRASSEFTERGFSWWERSYGSTFSLRRSITSTILDQVPREPDNPRLNTPPQPSPRGIHIPKNSSWNFQEDWNESFEETRGGWNPTAAREEGYREEVTRNQWPNNSERHESWPSSFKNHDNRKREREADWYRDQCDASEWARSRDEHAQHWFPTNDSRDNSPVNAISAAVSKARPKTAAKPQTKATPERKRWEPTAERIDRKRYEATEREERRESYEETSTRMDRKRYGEAPAKAARTSKESPDELAEFWQRAYGTRLSHNNEQPVKPFQGIKIFSSGATGTKK